MEEIYNFPWFFFSVKYSLYVVYICLKDEVLYI